MNPPDTSIVWLRDADGDFPHAVFSGDTDMITNGWVSFTSRARNEVILALITADEWNAGKAGIPIALQRLHAELSRDDLAMVEVWYEDISQPVEGITFAEFLKQYRPPIGHYKPLSGNGEAALIREESLEDFRSNGGLVTVVVA